MNESEALLMFALYKAATEQMNAAIDKLAREYMHYAFDDYDNGDPDDVQNWFIEIERVPEWGPDHILWEPSIQVLAWTSYDDQRRFKLPIAYLWDRNWEDHERKKQNARQAR